MWVLGVGLSWVDLRRRSVALLPFFWNHFFSQQHFASLPVKKKNYRYIANIFFTRNVKKKLPVITRQKPTKWTDPSSSSIHNVFRPGWLTICWRSDPPLQSDPSSIPPSRCQMAQVRKHGFANVTAWPGGRANAQCALRASRLDAVKHTAAFLILRACTFFFF